MKKNLLSLTIVALCSYGSSSAFINPARTTALQRIHHRHQPSAFHAILQHKSVLEEDTPATKEDEKTLYSSKQFPLPVTTQVAAVALLMALTTAPEAALAAVGPPNTAPIPNALVAYGHYAFILVVMGLLTFERFTVETGMSKEAEKSLVIADACYGLSAALLFVTGYFRAVEYGKGWDFYAHEPLFWLKLTMGGLLAGLSLFPTITLFKRGSKIFQDQPIEPMSNKLAGRMKQILNAEISAILSIPLIATLMARGVGYSDGFPWQAGAALTALALTGSSVPYAKQALTWTEEESRKESPK